MVKLRIIAVGKDKDRWVSEACAHYLKLLQRFAAVEIIIVPSSKSSTSMTRTEIMKREAERVAKEISKGVNIALSDDGKKMDTMSFSRWLERRIDTCGGIINFIIGGAYGLNETILKRANETVSLSPLTFSHQLVRLVLLEQVYRALSISHGTDYHK